VTVKEMAPYDSESSDEGEDYTETNVLLGYATKDSTGDTVSHLGGAPVRPSQHTTIRQRLIVEHRHGSTRRRLPLAHWPSAKSATVF
jgi:hypothetical protein